MNKNNILKGMLKGLVVMHLSVWLAIQMVWAEVELNPDHPQSYVVKKGDTLWDIAGQFLSHPWQWPEIWKGNPHIENPDLIYPGDIVQLVYVDGQATLVNGEIMQDGTRVLKLSPQSREEDLERAIHTVPIDAIRQFLTQSRVVSPGTLEQAAYIVDSEGEHVVASSGDKIYVRALESNGHKGYSVYRKGQVYVNPNDPGDILGIEAIHLADADLLIEGDPASLRLRNTNREIGRGDSLLKRTEEKMVSRFFPRPPNNEVEADIIAVFDGVSQIGIYNVVIIDLGEVDGMKPGIVLDVYRAGGSLDDENAKTHGLSRVVKLPDEKSGTVMVFRTFERVSYGLVMEATQPIHVMDKVKTPKL